ncbi:MAG: hypothetical protein HDQ93_02575 [Desulfovibrio sp.]|nr:hypothetical protein [Desulfovibrio sp.]
METAENRDLLLIGGGELCAAVIDALSASAWKPVGVVDNDRKAREVAGVPVVGSEAQLRALRKSFANALLTLDFSAGSRVRRYLFQLLKTCEYKLPPLAAPLAHSLASIGEGTLIMPHAIASENAAIGDGCLIGENCEIMPGASVGSFCVIEPGAIISENVEIGEGSRIGREAVIAAGAKLGKRCEIAPGVAVVKDIAPYKIVRE